MPNYAIKIIKGQKHMSEEQKEKQNVIDFPDSEKHNKDKTNSKNKLINFMKEYAGVFSFAISVVLLIYNIGVSRGTFSAGLSELKEDVKKIEDQDKKTSEDLNTLKNDMSNLQEEVSSVKEEVTSLKEDMESLESDMDGFKNSIDVIAYSPQVSLINGLSTVALKSDSGFLATPSWENNEVIAQNRATGRKYKAKELRDKKLLIPYTDDGQDAYFLGQFNKKNHWDGNCLINTYKDGKLTMIMEGRYKDGQLLSYQQVYSYKNTSKEPIWSVSERKKNGNVNTGETYTYYKTKSKKASFTKKTVEASDIMSVADFKEWVSGSLEGYYYGNTRNGNYNDKTGNAYLIKYNDDKTVRTLYCGNFKNGVFDDNTGKAWYTSYDSENSIYVYFKGQFVNGRPVETNNHKRKNISYEELHKIIDTIHFNETVTLCGDDSE